MFLMSAKSLSILFFVLTLINIPCYMFYYGSNPATETIQTPQQWFNALSLGSIGESAHACDVINAAQDTMISLSCNIGTLTSIRYLGLSKNDDSATCSSILHVKSIDHMLLKSCNTDYEKPG